MIEWWTALSALVAVLALLVAVLVRNAGPTGRTAHHDRSHLWECFRRGSLRDVPPTVLLEAMREGRASERLTMRGDGQAISLYYLRLPLAAVSGGADGEQLVLRALNLSTGDFEFDPT